MGPKRSFNLIKINSARAIKYLLYVRMGNEGFTIHGIICFKKKSGLGIGFLEYTSSLKTDCTVFIFSGLSYTDRQNQKCTREKIPLG